MNARIRSTKLWAAIVGIAVVVGTALVLSLPAKTSAPMSSPSTTVNSPELEGPCAGFSPVGQCYRLERADIDEKRTKGLSDRDSLAEQTGMLFVFDQSQEACIWMKDMRFKIDIIWLDEAKKIIKIGQDVSPDTYPMSFCAKNTKYVIELNSGDAAKLQLEPGTPLVF